MLRPIPEVLVSTPAPMVTEVGGPVGGLAIATAAKAIVAAAAIAPTSATVFLVRVLFMVLLLRRSRPIRTRCAPRPSFPRGRRGLSLDPARHGRTLWGEVE